MKAIDNPRDIKALGREVKNWNEQLWNDPQRRNSYSSQFFKI